MISCTRFYVYPTEALVGKSRKKKLLRLIKQLWENIRGDNSLFVIIISKDRKQAFKEAEKWI